MESVTLATRLETLQTHGSCLDLSWDEETGRWEVAWITAGERFRAVHVRLEAALAAVWQQAVQRFAALERDDASAEG
jgi:hypothetical protein